MIGEILEYLQRHCWRKKTPLCVLCVMHVWHFWFSLHYEMRLIKFLAQRHVCVCAWYWGKTAKAPSAPSIIWVESFSPLTKYLLEPWRQKGAFVSLGGENSLISPLSGSLGGFLIFGQTLLTVEWERSNVCASMICPIMSDSTSFTKQMLFSRLQHKLVCSYAEFKPWRKKTIKPIIALNIGLLPAVTI